MGSTKGYLSKKIAFFTPNFNGGGAERVMITYANELSARGADVYYVVVNSYGPIKSLLSTQVYLIDLKQTRVLTSAIPLYKVLKKNNITHLVSTLTHANIISIIAAKLRGKKTKSIIREASTPSKARKFNKSFLKNMLSSIIFPFADCVIAVSNGVREDFITTYKYPKNKISVVYNPLMEEETGNIPEEYRNVEDSTKIILAMGRVTPVKNYPLIIRAMYHLLQKESAHLFVIGQTDLDHEEFGKVNDIINELDLKDHISFLGFKNDFGTYLKYADLYTLFSHYEGLPNGLMQSLAFGVPSVTTLASDGISEILDNGRYGEIDFDFEPESYAAKMYNQLTAPKNTKSELIDRASFFSIDNTLSQLEEPLR
jgi:glycosyltransferase involved in cell wall biosynthesis